MPIGNCVKKLSDMSLDRCKTSLTKRLVDDPIRVVMPAKMQMKLSGIIYREAERRSREDIADSMGINMTTTGVLFINIDTAKATPNTNVSVRLGERSRALLILMIGPSKAPVWNMPWPTTKRAMMVMSAGAANPERRDELSKPCAFSGAKK